jgi:Holliday junction resolvase RusA-like endonuclease
MRSKSYCVNIPPIAWQRVVRSRNRMYNIHMKDRVAFGLYLSQQHNDEPLFEKPIHLEVVFYMAMGKTPKDKQYHAAPPYLDNLYTFLVDALKDVLIRDGRVICSLSLKKVYDKEPRTELIITEVV